MLKSRNVREIEWFFSGKKHAEAFDIHYLTELLETEKNNSKIQNDMELNVLEYSNES